MISVNPELIRLSWEEFKEWAERTCPEEDAEALYKSIGGKVPVKKEKGVK